MLNWLRRSTARWLDPELQLMSDARIAAELERTKALRQVRAAKIDRLQKEFLNLPETSATDSDTSDPET